MTHQVIVINKNLKMSKGKIARVCAYVTAQLVYSELQCRTEDLHDMSDYYKGVVLKADKEDYYKLMQSLKEEKCNFVQHIDAGLTQVKPLSNCGISFLYKGGNKLVDSLKLL